MTTTEDYKSYEAWRCRLNGEHVDIPRGVAPPGFYRATNTGQPVAVWISGDDDWLQKTGAHGQPDEVQESWCERIFAYCEPVTEEAYRTAVDTGIWPDHRVAPHNRPPEGLEGITAQLDDLRMQAEAYLRQGEAKSQTDANEAANLVQRIQGCVKQLEDERSAQLAPLDERLREIERQRVPIVRDRTLIMDRFALLTAPGDQTIAKLKNSFIGPFLIKLRAAAKAAFVNGGATPESGSAGRNRATGEASVTVNAGAKGAKVSIATRWWAEIEDYEKAYAALKDHPDVRATIHKIADSAARSKAKITIPGVAFKSEDKVR